MKTAYLDCFSGISGNMFLGAMLNAGLPVTELEKALNSLPLTGYSLDVKQVKRGELMGTLFTVILDEEGHEHRGLKEVKQIIHDGELSDRVKRKSIHIFESIAEEEGKIHGLPADRVHFHEVGAVDSIIDIVGTAFGIEFMDIGPVFSSSLPLGSGFVDSEHGRIPIPAPATVALLKGVPVYDSGLRHEMVTPTGAALIKEFASSFGPMPPMILRAVGYGAGTRVLPDRPNLLRMIIGEDEGGDQVETVVVLETNLDDTNPEWMGFLMDRLFEAGALDVAFCPVQMKKNRPGVQVQIIGEPRHMNSLMDILIAESTALGVRFRFSQRKVLRRSNVEIDSPWGRMNVKKIARPDGSDYILPEFETCKEIAKEQGLPLKEIYYWIMSLNRI